MAPQGLIGNDVIDGVLRSGLFDYPGALQTLFTGINDHGQFIGQHDGIGFLATTVPEPSSLAFLLTLIVCLAVIARRKHNLR